MLLPHCGLLGVSIKSWESGKILPYPHSSPWTLCLCPQARSLFLFGLFCQGFNLHIWGQSPTTGVTLPSSQVLLWEPYCIASESLQISWKWMCLEWHMATYYISSWTLGGRLASAGQGERCLFPAPAFEGRGGGMRGNGYLCLGNYPAVSSHFFLKITPVTPQSQAVAGTPVFLSQSLRRASSKAR